MRLLQATLLVALAGSVLPCQAGGEKKDEDKLQGTWIFSEGVINGLPFAQKEVVGGDIVIVIAGDKVTSKAPGKESRQSTFKLDATKTPKTIDMVALDGPHKGKTIQGIYHLEGDTLKICTPLDPEKTKRPTELAAPSKSGLIIMTLNRVKS